MSEFAKRLRSLRAASGITPVTLSKRLGFGDNMIYHYETDTDPTLAKAIKIADYFGVSLDALVGNKPSEQFKGQATLLEENAEMKEILSRTKRALEDFEFERGKLK